MAYTKGLHDLGDGCHAWLQPDGGWGWSNSGLVTGGAASLIVDTLFDLVTTRQMLDGIARLTERAPVTAVVNTHSDGDHCFGNELVAAPGVEIIASEAAAGLITQHAVEELAALKRYGDGLDVEAAVASIDLGIYARLAGRGRLAQNVAAVYRALDPQLRQQSLLDIFDKIAELEGFPPSPDTDGGR